MCAIVPFFGGTIIGRNVPEKVHESQFSSIQSFKYHEKELAKTIANLSPMQCAMTHFVGFIYFICLSQT